MDIQLYEMDKYVKQTIIGEKIPSNSKILSFNLLQGGTKPLITQESLETNNSNKGFLEIISNYFGSDLATRIKTLLPLASMYFLSSEFSSGQNGGGIKPEFKNYILPICTMIIGYSYKEKLGEDKFNVLAVVCVCYCIYLLSSTQKIKQVFEQFVGPIGSNNLNLVGGAKTTDEYGLLPMITQGIKWLSENITSLISKANDLMKNFISGTKITFENFSEQIIKFITGSKSIITPELLRLFEFNNSTGHIQFKGPSNYKIVTQITDKIFIYFNGDITTYKVNGEQLDTISTIQSKPFATALVLAYIEHMQSLGLGKTLISPSNEFNKYVYELAPDATVKIYEKETNKLVQSMGLAIQQWDSGDGITAAQTTQNVCKEMFGIDSQTKSNTCSKYFYSILGRSALGMIQILGTEAKSKSSVIQLLKQANPAIKYEILKNLEWKTNSKRNLIKLDEWIKLQSETRPEIAEYLQTESGKLVKEILENYITDVEQWIHSLEEPKELTKPIKSLGPKRLTATQVARLRSSQIEDTAKLIVTDLESKQTYTLKPMSGGECENNKNKTNNLCVQEFESKLATIKTKLEGGNKILSSNTETKIRLLINQVAGLEDFGPVNLYGKKLAQLTNVFGKLESLV